MSNFQKAIEYVLSNEGGFIDDIDDNGGMTNFGISYNFLKKSDVLYNHMSYDELSYFIKNMTKEQAINIYQKNFWDKNLDKINVKTACYILDMIVNHGKEQAIKLAQRATWSFHCGMDKIKDDGVFGEKTINAINFSAFYTNCMDDEYIAVLRAERAGFYRLISEINPSNKKFLKGWLNRTYSSII